MDHLPVKLLAAGARAPERTRAEDAAYDLSCLEAFSISPGQRLLVDTGFALALPPGTGGLILPRSGLANKHGVTVMNAPGLIDSEYRGPVKVGLINLSAERYAARAGDRIAQLLVVPYLAPAVTIVDELPVSADGRGESGFGSSGR